MRMAAHVNHLAQIGIAHMRGMQWIYLSVLRAGKVVYVVALNGLIEKRQTHQEHHGHDEERWETQMSVY